jgi:hypothetical protein
MTMYAWTHRLAACLLCGSISLAGPANAVAGQPQDLPPLRQTSAPPAVIRESPPADGRQNMPAAEARTSLRIPEGTEVHVHLTEPLSSATASAGDTFSIVTDEEIRLPGGVIIPSGYSGKGEVTQVEKSGMLGKPGQLSIRINYIKIGDAHVHLRANKNSEGKSNVTTMVVTTVLLTGLGLFIHGHSVKMPAGQPITAFVDDDATIDFPVAPPPRMD